MQKIDASPPPIVREYDIGGTRYIVTATVKAGAKEDAAKAICRLAEKEIRRMIQDGTGGTAEASPKTKPK
jgi:hypothetical protein